jgi:hypothetical protein
VSSFLFAVLNLRFPNQLLWKICYSTLCHCVFQNNPSSILNHNAEECALHILLCVVVQLGACGKFLPELPITYPIEFNSILFYSCSIISTTGKVTS